jgi:hypothetical protein
MSAPSSRRRLLLAGLLVPLLGAPAVAQTGTHTDAQTGALNVAPAEDGGPVGSVYAVLDDATRLAVRDLTGDGRKDLLIVDPDGLALRRLEADGRYDALRESRVAWPSQTVGWNLADLDGDGLSEIVLLIDGTRVATVRPDASGALVLGPTLFENGAGFLPRGVRRINFVRDVDGDGRQDVVVPSAGRFHIHFNREEGWSAPLPVTFQAKIELSMGDPQRLDRSMGEEVSIPWFTMQDVDGDGRSDLVSQTSDEARFHLARPGLTDQPTWTLDLGALKAEAARPQRVDLDNLLANVELPVNWRAADLDGEPPNDLVLQLGGKVSVYKGGSTGPALDRPDQVLKASGNVLYFLLRDTDGDGRPDLQLLRAETISIGDALRLLVVPGSLDFDVFSYKNEAGTFARKPTTRTTLALRIPALLGFLDDVETMRDTYDARREVPAQPATLGGDGAENDIVDVIGDGVGVFLDRVPAGFKQGGLEQLKGFGPDELLEQYALSKLDQLSDGSTLSVELKDIEKLLVTPGWELRTSLGTREPDAVWPLPFPGSGAKLLVDDLDGDGRSDIVVMGRDAEQRRWVQFFVTR